MGALKGASGVVLLEEVRGQHGEFHNLEAQCEVEQVMGILVRNLGKDMFYRLWRTHGPDRTGVVNVSLGYQIDQKEFADSLDPKSEFVVQQGLESMPLQTLAIKIHALLMTLEQRFEEYHRDLLNPGGADNWR